MPSLLEKFNIAMNFNSIKYIYKIKYHRSFILFTAKYVSIDSCAIIKHLHQTNIQ